MSGFGAHSTQHASTFAAHATGDNVDVIQNSQVFEKFYHRPLEDQQYNFALSVLNRDTDNPLPTTKFTD